MKRFSILLIAVLSSFFSRSQGDNAEPVKDVSAEIVKLKEAIKQMQENELQSDKAKYQKNYQLIVNGIEIIKEIHQGTVEISTARSQNILYKKLIDVNNPSSDILGFQLFDVINKTMEDNINLLPLADHEKNRLKNSVSGLFEGLKRTFPPLQIISSTFSVFSSFNIFKPRIEKLSKKADSLVIDVTNPITKEVLIKINTQLQPYIDFYTELNITNAIFENALYQHGVQYRDFIEEVNVLKETIEKKINLNEPIGDQINGFFDLANSSRQDFNYKEKTDNENIKDLVGNCISIYDMVDRYKKFSNDFTIIQDDFYKNNIELLKQKAKNLPYKDNAKIDQLLTDMDHLKNGNAAENLTGFDASYKLRMKSILAKVYIMNKLRM